MVILQIILGFFIGLLVSEIRNNITFVETVNLDDDYTDNISYLHSVYQLRKEPLYVLSKEDDFTIVAYDTQCNVLKEVNVDNLETNRYLVLFTDEEIEAFDIDTEEYEKELMTYCFASMLREAGIEVDEDI